MQHLYEYNASTAGKIRRVDGNPPYSKPERKEVTYMTRNYNRNPLRIFIGVGHGGADPGAVNHKLGLTEAGINLSIALLMQTDLRRHGVQVKLSRSVDEEDRLKEEIAECNAYAPDFAVELHTNAGGGTGFEVYYQLEPWEHSKPSMEMAQLFDTNVCKYLGVNTRGLKTNRSLGWLNQVQAPCILVEHFFIDGPDAVWYSRPEQLAKLSRAYVRSILEYYGIAYVADGCETLRYQVLGAETCAKDYVCPAVLLNGSYYVHLRQMAKSLGLAVYYEETTRKILLYPPEDYTESDVQNRLLKNSDCQTAMDRVMAGLEPENSN